MRAGDWMGRGNVVLLLSKPLLGCSPNSLSELALLNGASPLTVRALSRAGLLAGSPVLLPTAVGFSRLRGSLLPSSWLQRMAMEAVMALFLFSCSILVSSRCTFCTASCLSFGSNVPPSCRYCPLSKASSLLLPRSVILMCFLVSQTLALISSY